MESKNVFKRFEKEENTIKLLGKWALKPLYKEDSYFRVFSSSLSFLNFLR